MLTALVVFLRSIGLICRGHRPVALENLALRQQVAALTRSVKSPDLCTRNRLFWLLLSKGAGVAHGLDRGPARDRSAVAPPMAPSSVGAALETVTYGSP